jgi:Zn-dependent peptidase ImmA (M78 family)
LLTWAVSHELGHATCGEPDEARADAHGRELREGKILSCSQSPGRQSNP